MYNIRTNLMLGFHGCDESVRDELVINPNIVKKSQESFDWLGHGFYIWENNYERALKWAEDKKRRGTINTPSIVGVVYQLAHCLDFTESTYIDTVSIYYDLMKADFITIGKEIPQNQDLRKDIHKDLILRELDCAVIEYMHQKIDEQIKEDIATNNFSYLKHFDTIRGVFTEGGPAFEGAGIQTKSHIQICIRNLNCIKAFFIPRKEISFP
ncbi:MAG TPA: hypothetical protein PKD85_14425 [Saprospiraceae bacterium]|nr:hypothetical protein [Saprospiraceae bacterium]